MDDTLRLYASQLIESRIRSAATADPLARATYEAMADEFVAKIADDAGIAADGDGPDDTDYTEEAATQPIASTGALPRLLVLDDQPEITVLIQRVAEGLGYEVRIVNRSIEAFAAFKEFSPDVIITDLVMPDVDGLEFLQMIRSTGRTPRILVMSGYGAFYLRLADTLATGAGLPAVTTMSKPISRGDLIGFLKSAIGA